MSLQGFNEEAVANLIRGAKRGKFEAFRGLYENYSSRVLNFAFKMLSNREEAEDVTQETFIAVWRKIHSLKADSRFEAWLFRIARNFIYQRYRLKGNEGVSLESEEVYEAELQKLPAGGNSPEDALLAKELRGVIDRVIGGLPVKYRAVFVLSALQGFSYQAIAEIMGKSLPSVKTDIHRARTQVRDQIKQFMGEVPDD